MATPGGTRAPPHHEIVRPRQQQVWNKRSRPVMKLTVGDLKRLLQEAGPNVNEQDTLENLMAKMCLSPAEPKRPVPETKTFAPVDAQTPSPSATTTLAEIPPPTSTQNKFADIPGVQLESPYRFYLHQYQAIEWQLMRENANFHGMKGGLHSLEMGTGKTLVMLGTVAFRPGPTASLYVCNKTLVGAIRADVAKFFGTRLRTLIFTKSVLGHQFTQFTNQTCRKNDLVITTYDTVKGLAQAAGLVVSKRNTGSPVMAAVANAFFQSPWFRIIADESQRMANSKSQLFRAMMQFLPGFRMCLTGTPMRNYEDDIFAQLHFLGFNKCRLNREQTIQNYRQLQLGNSILCRSLLECQVRLPARHERVVDVHLTREQQAAYNFFLKASAKVLQHFQETKSVSFAVVLQKFTRLRQVCIAAHLVTGPNTQSTGFPQLDKWLADKKGSSGYHSAKLQTMLRLIHTLPLEDKVLIFSEWSHANHLVHELLEQTFGADSVSSVDGGTKDRDRIFNHFREAKGPRFLCLTSVGSTGLTFTNANHVIILQPGWNDVFEKQSAARVWRIGQTKEVYIWKLVVPGSIESNMIELNQRKSNIRKDMMEQGINADMIGKALGIIA